MSEETMEHFIYTLDIATPRKLTTAEQYDIIMKIDAILEAHPLEFEDWRITTATETRAI